MKHLTLFFSFLAIGANAEVVLPQGSFAGEGVVWTSKSAPKPYRVWMTVRGNDYVERWESSERKGLLHLKGSAGSNGEMTFQIAESTHGALRGYFSPRQKIHIHGTATNGSDYEQTLTFGTDKIEKLGSETDAHGFRVMWDSTLHRVKPPTTR